MRSLTLPGILPSSRPRPYRLSRHSSCRLRGSFASHHSPSPSNPTSRAQAHLHKLNNQLPRFLRTYTTPLLNAPVAHITSFLILHEITAIVPLFGLAGAFHYAGWIPAFETGRGSMDEGMEKFGKWLRKKGWVDGKAQDEPPPAAPDANGVGQRVGHDLSPDNGVRLILEFATAYAITKALLPLRIVMSVWATPSFARTVIAPVARAVGRIFGRQKKATG